MNDCLPDCLPGELTDWVVWLVGWLLVELEVKWVLLAKTTDGLIFSQSYQSVENFIFIFLCFRRCKLL